MNNLNAANAVTPTPGNAWRRLSCAERQALVKNSLNGMPAISDDVLDVVETKEDGQVIMRLIEPLSADKRGALLLDVEAYLKETIDEALVVWLEPLGDKSSLRNLRGIEVKS